MPTDADNEFDFTIENVPEPPMSGAVNATKIIHGKLIPPAATNSVVPR